MGFIGSFFQTFQHSDAVGYATGAGDSDNDSFRHGVPPIRLGFLILTECLVPCIHPGTGKRLVINR
jgi:hypothetical protein